MALARWAPMAPRWVLSRRRLPCKRAGQAGGPARLGQRDHDLAFGAAGFDMGKGGVGFGKGIDAVDDRADVACVDQGGDFCKLRAIGRHEQKIETDPALLGLFGGAAAEEPEDGLQEPRGLDLGGEGGGCGAGDGDKPATGAQDIQGFVQNLGVLAVEDDIIVAQDRFKVLCLVVNDQIRAEGFQPFGVCGAGGGGDIGPDVFGQLDGDGADAAGTGLDEDFLPGAEFGDIDQRLPSGERDQGERSGLCHVKRRGFRGKRAFLDGNEFGKGADAEIIDAGIDFVTDLIMLGLWAGAHHGSGHVVAEDEGHFIGQDGFEFPITDLGVQKIDAGGVDLNQNLILMELGFGNIGEAERGLLLVFVQKEGFHGYSPILLRTVQTMLNCLRRVRSNRDRGRKRLAKAVCRAALPEG
jgi:hypothetical protein